MNEKTAVKIREKWVDDVKVIACILVVLGHFFQSMTKANILPENGLYQWFNTTIYYFHVPLFFICSGYLYQKYSKVNNVDSWCRNVAKKVLALGVPYVTFTTATWVLKKVFSSSVNDQIGGLGDTLFLHPTAPYWYLYALFFIFLVTPTFSEKKVTLVGVIIAVILRIIISQGVYSVYAVSVVFAYEIWFVFGMSICVYDIQLNGKGKMGAICGILFVVISVIVYVTDMHKSLISFSLGILACISILLIVADFKTGLGKWSDFLAKYTMPIYLMHTLFAAPMRSALLKISIGNAVIHVVLGLGISFVGPIIAARIMEKTKWLEFFLYPNKIIKQHLIRGESKNV